MNFFNHTIDGIVEANEKSKELSYRFDKNLDSCEDVDTESEDYINFTNYENYNEHFDTACQFIINNLDIILKKLEDKKDQETIELILDRFCLHKYWKPTDKEGVTA